MYALVLLSLMRWLRESSVSRVSESDLTVGWPRAQSAITCVELTSLITFREERDTWLVVDVSGESNVRER